VQVFFKYRFLIHKFNYQQSNAIELNICRAVKTFALFVSIQSPWKWRRGKHFIKLTNDVHPLSFYNYLHILCHDIFCSSEMINSETRVQIGETDTALSVSRENAPFLPEQPSYPIQTEPIDTLFCSKANEHDVTQWNKESSFSESSPLKFLIAKFPLITFVVTSLQIRVFL
jgi:hypothetical protein